MFGLDGKVALVTGCSRGIGRRIATALAEAGADIIGVSTSRTTLENGVGEEIRALGKGFRAFGCDLADRAALDALIAELNRNHRSIDILVNNAGTIERAPAAGHSDAYWDKVIAVNLTAQFILSREMGRSMVERGCGKIIFIASLLTFQGGINVPGYAAAKGGVGQLTKALANEWANQGVNVNAIAPGYVETDNTYDLRQDPARFKAILERIPAGRWGTPDDFAGPAVFLASSASDYVNGTILTVDGGWMGR